MMESLMEYLFGPQDDHKSPDGYCPNCWGEQEYGNKIRDLARDKQIDVNNKKAQFSFIRQFVVRYVDGIQLKKGTNGYECPTCHLKLDEE